MDRGRLLVFSLAASISYTVAYYFNWPLLVYYPVVNEVHLFQHGRTDGFPVLWYGWLATATIIGAVAAWILPRRWANRLPFDLSWVVLIIMIVAALTYEKRWF